MKILIADDEQSLLNFLERGLRAESYECIATNQLHEVSVLAQKNRPSLIILDRLFADDDSIKEIQNIRQKVPHAMLLLLTALDDVSERVAGLKHGADDYLCKPFDFEELLARIEALARRSGMRSENERSALSIGTLRLDRENRLAFSRNVELNLT